LVGRPAGKTTIKLAVPERERGWWRRLWKKILSPLPNCNAVENRPAFSVCNHFKNQFLLHGSGLILLLIIIIEPEKLR
jgi:hypothetical protein